MKQVLLRYGTNPIIMRELRGALRKGASFVSLLLVALLAVGAISLAWLALTERGEMGQSDFVNQVSRSLFMSLSYAIFVLGSLIVLVSTSNMITVERENKTFELLIATGLARWQIILGKLISALGFIFFLIVATLPVISICFIMGGVSFGEMFTAYVAIFTTLAAVGMIGIMCSAFCSTSKKAQGLAFLIAIILYLGLPYGIEILREILEIPRRGSLNPFFWLSPYFNFARIFYGTGFLGVRAGGILASASPMTLILIANGAVGILGFLIARRYFISPERMRTKTRKKYIEDQKTLRKRKKRFPYYLVDPLKKNREIQDHEKPAYVKEKRYTFSSKIVYIIRFSYSSLLIGFFLSLVLFFSEGEEVIFIFSVLALLIGMVFTTNLSSGAVVEEVEKETFDLLRSTLITPQQVFFAKLWFTLKNSCIVVIAFLLPPLVFSASGLSWARWYGRLQGELNSWLLGINMVVMGILLCCGLGLYCSTNKTSRRSAQTAAIGGFILLSLLPMFVVAICSAVEYFASGGRRLHPGDWEALGHFLGGFLSPVHYLIVAADKLQGNKSPQSYILTSNLCYLVFITAFYRFTYLRFRKIWFEGFRTVSFFSLLFGKARKRVWNR